MSDQHINKYFDKVFDEMFPHSERSYRFKEILRRLIGAESNPPLNIKAKDVLLGVDYPGFSLTALHTQEDFNNVMYEVYMAEFNRKLIKIDDQVFRLLKHPDNDPDVIQENDVAYIGYNKDKTELVTFMVYKGGKSGYTTDPTVGTSWWNSGSINLNF